MASRYRSLSRPAFSLIKSTVTKPTTKPKPSPFLHDAPSSVTVPRSVPRLGCVQSLLPLHSAVSSARLTSCLGIDSTSSRSMTQEKSSFFLGNYFGVTVDGSSTFWGSLFVERWVSAHHDKRFRRSLIDEL